MLRNCSVILGAALITFHSPVYAQTTTTNCTANGNQLNCTQYTPPPPDNSMVQLGAASLQAMALEQAAQAQAAWAAAGRQAEQAAVTAKERADQTDAAIQDLTRLTLSSPPTLAPVNKDLTVDWSTMDGVTESREYKLDGGVRRRVTVSFALNPTPSGGRFVQMRVDSRIFLRQVFNKIPIANEIVDGRHDLTTGITLLTSSREPLRPDVGPLYESLVLIGENSFVAKMSGVSQSKAPIGTVPSPALGFVIAAMPGTLADSISLWVLDWETGNVLPAQFTLRERTMKKIPVAVGGASCEEKTPTKPSELPVVIYKMRIGVREETKTFLARVPHLPISDETKCIDLER